MTHNVCIIGVGPGNPDYITTIGKKKIAFAQVVVGAKRLLNTFALPGQETFPVTAHLSEALHFIQEKRENGDVAVLVSGDSGIYSYASYLSQELGLIEVEIIPGISAIQLMFAKLKRPWHDAKIVSMHGKDCDNLIGMIESDKPVAVLTDGKHTPAIIACRLREKGCSNKSVAVGCNLSCKDEFLYFGDLDELSNSSKKLSNSVVVFNYE